MLDVPSFRSFVFLMCLIFESSFQAAVTRWSASLSMWSPDARCSPAPRRWSRSTTTTKIITWEHHLQGLGEVNFNSRLLKALNLGFIGETIFRHRH